MRQKNYTIPVRLISPGIIIMLITTMIFTSCKKTATAPLPEKNELQEAAEFLNGQLLWGKLTNGGMEDNVVYLDYNDGAKVILIQLVPGNSLEIPSMDNAVIITSQHGVIIKNPVNNSVLLFPQNDTESILKFNKLSSLFKKSNEQALIAGTILLNFNS